VIEFDCVVAADAANGIGKDNDLPWPRMREDLRFLKRITCEAPEGRQNAVLMGRKTWESVPSKQQPLPGRLNVVISRGAPTMPDGVVCAPSLDDALALAAPRVAGLFVIGGAQIYAQAFAHPSMRFLYLTRIEATFGCDTFLPPIDRFELDEVLARHREHDIDYSINRFRRRPGT
jgi:dihydrofolate reductase